MSISLLIDVYSKQRSADSLHVVDRDSYLVASRALDEALDNGISLSVVLHNPALIRWFDHYKGRINFSSYDPCAELAATLDMRESLLPAELLEDPKFIISAALNEKAKVAPPSAPEKLTSWVLEQTLDPVWGYDSIDTFEQLSSVLLYLVKRQNQKIHPTLQALRNRKIAAWKTASDLKKVVSWLFSEEPSRRAESLFFAKMIWKYPHEIKVKGLQFGNRWQEISLLEDYQLVIPKLPIHYCRELALPPEIRLVIDEYLTRSLEDNRLDSVIGILSGIAEEEIAVKRYLENQFESIDDTWSDILQELNNLFSHNQKSTTFITYLQSLLPIRRPSSIAPSMSWDDVSAWLENEYFPYYRWCTALEKLPHTEPTVAAFEDWLVHNYYNLTKTAACALCVVQPLVASRAQESPVLHVILDCLPWEYAQYLQGKLRDGGIESMETSMHITTLPSITRIAKPSLIRGQLLGQLPPIPDQSSKTYSEMFAQAVKLNTEEVLCGTSNDTDIASMVKEPRKAYLYLDNDIDGLAHRQMTPDRRRVKIENHLNDIVEGVISAREIHKRLYGSELAVVISSDHGFTELPDTNTILPISEIDWNIEHGRLLINPGKENPSPDDYHHISKEMLGGADETFYVAKGYRTVKGRPRGGVHGGITPQEAVVAVIVIDSSVDTTFHPVKVGIGGDVRRGRISNVVSIEIFNSNSAPVTVKSLELRLITMGDSTPRRIGPGETVVISGNVDGSRIKEEVVPVTGAISLSFRGRDIMDNFEYLLPTTGAATSDTAFEDEFDI